MSASAAVIQDPGAREWRLVIQGPAHAEYLIALAMAPCNSPFCACAEASDPDTWYAAEVQRMAERAPA